MSKPKQNWALINSPVVVHALDAPLTDGAVVRPFGLDRAALGALVEHLAVNQAQLLDGLLGGRPSRHCSLHSRIYELDLVHQSKENLPDR